MPLCFMESDCAEPFSDCLQAGDKKMHDIIIRITVHWILDFKHWNFMEQRFIDLDDCVKLKFSVKELVNY